MSVGQTQEHEHEVQQENKTEKDDRAAKTVSNRSDCKFSNNRYCLLKSVSYLTHNNVHMEITCVT